MNSPESKVFMSCITVQDGGALRRCFCFGPLAPFFPFLGDHKIFFFPLLLPKALAFVLEAVPSKRVKTHVFAALSF